MKKINASWFVHSPMLSGGTQFSRKAICVYRIFTKDWKKRWFPDKLLQSCRRHFQNRYLSSNWPNRARGILACSSEFGWPEEVKFPRNKYLRACAWGSWKIFPLLWKGTEVRLKDLIIHSEAIPWTHLGLLEVNHDGNLLISQWGTLLFGHRRIQHIFWLNTCRGLIIVCYVHHENPWNTCIINYQLLLSWFLSFWSPNILDLLRTAPLFGTVRMFFDRRFQVSRTPFAPWNLRTTGPCTTGSWCLGIADVWGSWGDMCWDYRTTFNQ